MDIPISELRTKLATQGAKGTVRVNQRSLIDKLLARYKGEHTLFRELVQNADDAGASCVVIQIHYTPHNLNQNESEEQDEIEKGKCTISISNNGRPFTEDDWDRLQSIADGNPDENITGMFGVGFYSVFALTPSPIVRSGRSALMFEWQGNQLATSRLDEETKKADSVMSGWSDVVLDAVPVKVCKSLIGEGGLKLARYLSEMLPFSRNLNKIHITHQEKEGPAEENSVMLYEVRKELKSLPHMSSKKGGKSQAGYFEMLSGITTSEVKLIFSSKQSDDMDQLEPSSTTTLSSSSATPSSSIPPSTSTPPSPPAPPTSVSPPAPTPDTLPPATPTPPRISYSVEVLSLTLVEAALGSRLDAETAKGVREVLKKNAPAKTRIAFLFQRDVDLANAPPSTDGAGDPAASGTMAVLRSYFSSALSYAFGGSPTLTEVEKAPSDQAISDAAKSTFYNRFQGRQGNIFVGFSTGQDTGCMVDISAQLYPTMEREHIDMNGYVGKWNIDLLQMCGVVLRVFYDCLVGLQQETFQLPPPKHGKKGKKGAKQAVSAAQEITPADSTNTVGKYFYELVSFAQALKFGATSPAKEVAQLLKQGFLSKDENALRVPTSANSVMSVAKVKLPCMGLEKFVNCPLLHNNLVENMTYTSHGMSKKQKNKGTGTQFTMNPCFANFLMEKNLISPVRAGDVIEELKEEDNILSEEKFVKILQAIIKWHEEGILGENVRSVLGSLKWFPGNSVYNTRHFASIRFFMYEEIFHNLHLGSAEPPSTAALEQALESTGEVLHFRVSKQFSSTQLERIFGLQKIPSDKICELISAASSHRILFGDPKTAMQALVLYSRNDTFNKTYLALLQRAKCMPTDNPDVPLALPSDTYFREISLGKNLLHITAEAAGLIAKNFLVTLGVHETISTKMLLEIAETQGDSIALVIGQLLEMHNRLHPTDWEHLRAESFLPGAMKKQDGAIEKSKDAAHALLFPDVHGVLLDLGFKVLDWEGATKLQKNFLKDIGVKTHPDLKALLNVAATTTSRDICFKAIMYLLDNFDIYRKEYGSLVSGNNAPASTPSKKKGQQTQHQNHVSHAIAFVPVSHPDRVLVRKSPKQCYCTPIISEELRHYLNLVNGVDLELILRRPDLKDKLQIPHHPPISDIVTEMSIKGLPPTLAKECFEFLSTHWLGSFKEDDWKALRNAKFIPIPDRPLAPLPNTAKTAPNKEIKPNKATVDVARDSKTAPPKTATSPAPDREKPAPNQESAPNKETGDVAPPPISYTFMRPSELVMESDQVRQQYRSLLDYVPAAYGGKVFLRSCGIPEYPDDERFIMSLIRNYRRFFMNEDLKVYLNALYKVKDMYDRLSASSMNRLQSTPCFLALRGTAIELCSPPDAVLVDNQVYCNIFEPLACPRDTDLENLYAKLGSKWLTSCIITKYASEGTPKKTPTSERYFELIDERLPLFVYDPDTREVKHDLKPNYQQVLKGISVMEVDSITKTLTYKGKTKQFPEEVGLQSPTSTVILISKQVASNPKFESATLHGISRVLATLLFVRLKYSEASQIFFILRNTLESLESEGFPVAALAKKPSASANGKKQKPAEPSEDSDPLGTAVKKSKQRGTDESQVDVGAGGTYDPESWNRSLENAVSRKPNSKQPPQDINETGGVFPVKGCEITVAQRLKIASGFDAGLPMYEEEGQERILKPDLISTAKEFSKVLRGIATYIFKIPSIDTSIAMFTNTEHRRSSSSASIAFNKGGRLYFNFAYYLDYQTHVPLYQVWHYWFITFCHEIAHNIEENHNQRHEHITDALQTKYFPKFSEVIGARPASNIPAV